MLKLEPTEAEALLVPQPDPELAALLPEVDEFIRVGDLERVLDLVDPVVLGAGLKLSEPQIAALRAGAEQLRARRRSRGRAAR